ncbi:MAG: histidine ammonia-lyase, partial [Pseudomonadota bacterium]
AEDHVQIGVHAEKAQRRMGGHGDVILGVEAMCAAQGLEFRAPLQTSAPLQRAVATLRAHIPSLGDDRYLKPSLDAASALIASGALTDAVDLPAIMGART